MLTSSKSFPYPKGEKNGHRRWPYMRVPNKLLSVPSISFCWLFFVFFNFSYPNFISGADVNGISVRLPIGIQLTKRSGKNRKDPIFLYLTHWIQQEILKLSFHEFFTNQNMFYNCQKGSDCLKIGKNSLFVASELVVGSDEYIGYCALGPSLYYVSIFLDLLWPTLPPTHYISINVIKNGHFLTPPTQSFCWRNIGMVPV